MRWYIKVQIGAALLLLCFGRNGHTRPVPALSQAKLLKESDVAVIATAIATSDAKDAPINHPGWVKLAALNTTFKVQAILKGDYKGEELTLLHHRLDYDGTKLQVIINGPSLVKFREKGWRFGVSNTPPPEYLLYLKKRSDGRFEAVTGFIDPRFSVRELVYPDLLPALEDMLKSP